MDKNTVLVSGAFLLRDQQGKMRWFIVKQPDGDFWEIPKVIVRKGESSVRAVIRNMGEKGGMTVRVLEEVGRAGGAVTSKNKTLPQRDIYYLMILKSGSKEAVGFGEYSWSDYKNATKKLSSKREKTMLKTAIEIYKKWKKKRQSKKI